MQFFAPFVVKKGNRIAPVVALVLVASVLVVLLSQTAFAQNTYVITDGDQVTVHTSYAGDLDEVLVEAGIQLDEDDFYTTNITEDGSRIVLRRAQNVSINYCGQQVQVNSYGETLEEILTRMNLSYGKDYQISLPLNAESYDGMEVTVNRVVQSRETYTAEIAYEVLYCSDDTLPEGEEKLITEGVTGQKMCTADVVYFNGEEQERTVIHESVVQEPVAQVVAVGTGKNVGQVREEPLIGDGVIVLASGEVLTYTSAQQFTATAYTRYDDGCDNITSTGSVVRHGVVAVDPSVIPYGTRMFIVSNDGEYIYGLSTAEDCGGSIKNNRIDLFVETLSEAFQFGRRDCTVYFLGDANRS